MVGNPKIEEKRNAYEFVVRYASNASQMNAFSQSRHPALNWVQIHEPGSFTRFEPDEQKITVHSWSQDPG